MNYGYIPLPKITGCCMNDWVKRERKMEYLRGKWKLRERDREREKDKQKRKKEERKKR